MAKRLAALAFLVLAAFGLATVPAVPAQAAPMLFGSNYYDFVQVVSTPFDQAAYDTNTFALASASAAATVFGGVNGQIAKVGSLVENTFLFGLAPPGFTSFRGAWLLGEGGYSNYGGGEPNNGGAFPYMNIGGTFAGIAPGKWADDSGVLGTPDPSADPVIGYFIEWENPQVNGVVPEPATLTMLSLGLLGYAAIRRRR